MSRHQRALAPHDTRQNLLNVVRQHAGRGVAQALAAGRRDVVGAPPDVHLLFAPALARVVLVEADEVAIVALVERLVGQHRNVALAHLFHNEIERARRPLERRRERNVERDAQRLELAAGGARFGNALRRKVDVAPAGEQVLEVPLALAVAHEHEKAVGHLLPRRKIRTRSSRARRSWNKAPVACRAPTAPP